MIFDIPLVMPKLQLPEYPRSGLKAMSVEERKRERKSVLTMVSTYARTKSCAHVEVVEAYCTFVLV